jgi:hypothetical protein
MASCCVPVKVTWQRTVPAKWSLARPKPRLTRAVAGPPGPDEPHRRVGQQKELGWQVPGDERLHTQIGTVESPAHGRFASPTIRTQRHTWPLDGHLFLGTVDGDVEPGAKLK